MLLTMPSYQTEVEQIVQSVGRVEDYSSDQLDVLVEIKDLLTEIRESLHSLEEKENGLA